MPICQRKEAKDYMLKQIQRGSKEILKKLKIRKKNEMTDQAEQRNKKKRNILQREGRHSLIENKES